ncbi:hypothetical protein SDC9_110687 [bioreactor metagenome]|uniref:Glycosyltransferase RgtA/B/C/D-like domain-containing protein n=1 Tax=bioreactor metagenome TaxID=1076179 RepID=A0A645BKP9_9ZZZZ
MFISACMTLFFVGLTAALLRITFLTNDDASIMYTFAGYFTGEPYPIHGFVNLPLGYLTSLLYMILPQVPWWPVLQLLSVAISIWVIFYTLWDIGAANNTPHAVMIAILTLLYALVLVYPVARLSFTLTACMLGTAGVLRLFSNDTGGQVREPLSLLALLESLALMIGCFLFRNSTGFSMICFWAAGVVYHALNIGFCWTAEQKKQNLKRLGLYAIAGIAIFAALIWLNNWSNQNMNPEGYAAFEEARGEFFDFPHVAYDEDPDFYASIGWDRQTYNLVSVACFIDPGVTADRLNAVVAHGAVGAELGLTARLQAAFAYGETFFRTNGAGQYMLVVPVLTALAAGLYFLRERKRGVEMLMVFGLALGAFALCLYLCLVQRLILRAFQVIALPTAVLFLPLLLRIRADNRAMPLKRWGRGIGLAMLLLSLFGLGWSMTKTVLWFDSYHPAKQIEQMREAEAYAMDHSENVYIVQPTFIYNNEAFKTYPGEKPTNIIDWGDTGMYSGWKTRQLEKNGLSALTPEIFRQERVYLMGTQSAKELQVLIDYLIKDAGAAGVERVDLFGGDYAVYKVVY